MQHLENKRGKPCPLILPLYSMYMYYYCLRSYDIDWRCLGLFSTSVLYFFDLLAFGIR